MSKPIEASLSISLYVDCPHCDDYFDLMEIEGINDSGELTRQACPDGYWSDAHDKFDEKINCPECMKEIHIKGIAW